MTEPDIPCPVCGEQAGRVFVDMDGVPKLLHVGWDPWMYGDECVLDPVDARFVGWMLNNPEWV